MKDFKLPFIPIIIFLLALFTFLSNADAKVKVSNIEYVAKNGITGSIIVKFKGALKGTPELTIKNSKKGGNSVVQILIPNSTVWPKIEKKITLGKKMFDTTLMVYQYNKKLVRFRALLPYSLENQERKVNVVLKDDAITLNFPLPNLKGKNKNININKKTARVSKYDESYLEKLLKDKKEVPHVLGDVKEQTVVDKVNTILSSANDTISDSTSKFSISRYIGKFVAFLGVVLLLFYGVIFLLKKGVIKKGKLGFLNDMKSVSVLNTTYVSPKKSLLMVKAHKQVFLLASDEKGIHFLSEIDQVATLLKEGEKVVAGSNFDTSLADIGNDGRNFNLKDDVAAVDILKNNNVNETVKLSDQIKKRVKNLKSLQ